MKLLGRLAVLATSGILAFAAGERAAHASNCTQTMSGGWVCCQQGVGCAWFDAQWNLEGWAPSPNAGGVDVDGNGGVTVIPLVALPGTKLPGKGSELSLELKFGLTSITVRQSIVGIDNITGITERTRVEISAPSMTCFDGTPCNYETSRVDVDVLSDNPSLARAASLAIAAHVVSGGGADADAILAELEGLKIAVHDVSIQTKQLQALEIDQASRLDNLLLAALQVPEGADGVSVQQQFDMMAAALNLP